jgi:metallophosphoesterase (TIGR00282 family)|tara:strand:- start:1222 stop:2028 length:807 start_codon:yes stop_codon:yes gene_type:complete
VNLLILGDIMGASGRKALSNKLPELIKKNKIDFVIVNGENASDDGRGITKEITEDFFKSGVDVITSGNHIWDKKETTEFIEKENRLLRPANLVSGSPGRGYKIYFSKNKKFKVGVLNLMGNVFMRKTEDVFKTAREIRDKMKLKKNVDFFIVDFHGEITSEKMAAGHFFDGKATCVVGTHTHVPTADTRILDGGTAYQTDIGMCGDYNSVIGMNKENSIKRFLKEKDAVNHFPAVGEGTLSGVIVETNFETGLAKKITRLICGGSLAN